jgi:hypothetical protein
MGAELWEERPMGAKPIWVGPWGAKLRFAELMGAERRGPEPRGACSQAKPLLLKAIKLDKAWVGTYHYPYNKVQ